MVKEIQQKKGPATVNLQKSRRWADVSRPRSLAGVVSRGALLSKPICLPAAQPYPAGTGRKTGEAQEAPLSSHQGHLPGCVPKKALPC